MKKIVLPLLVALPSVAAAQTTTISSFVAADAGVRGEPVVLGATVGRESGVLGIRWSTGVDAASTVGARAPAGDGPDGLLVTELDALLLPPAALGDLPVTPYGFAGVGGRWIRDQEAVQGGALWSYGAGVRMPLAGPLRMEGEARHRKPLGAAVEGTTPGWEYRFGVALGFGGRRVAPPRPAPAPLPLPVPIPVPSGDSEASARRHVALRAIDSADDLLGVHYTWGGNTPQQGFDCSGFVRYVFLRQGIDLPRVSRDQARAGIPLPLDLAQLEPGDLIAFASDGREVDHIAIYVGDGRIIHSSASGKGVRFDDLNSQRGRWYVEHMVAARRVIPGGVLADAQ